MGSAVSSVTKSVGKLVGGIGGGVAEGAGATVDQPAEYRANPDSFKLTPEETAFQIELNKRFKGEGPSVAENQLKQATDRNIANIYAQAAAQRTNQALVQREAMRAGAQANQEAANQSAQVRAQEMQNNAALYADVVNRERQAKQAMEATNAGVAANNQDAQIRAQTANAQARVGIIGGIGQGAALAGGSDRKMKTNITEIKADYPRGETKTVEGRNSDGKTAAEAGKSKDYSKPFETLSNTRIEAGSAKKAYVGETDTEERKLSSGPKAVAFSDEKTKKDKNSNPSKEFINSLKAYTYEYKDTSQPGTAPGKQLGVMAQDLEKSEIGKQLVTDTPNGKMVDFGKAIAPMLATQALMNQEVEGLKRALKNRKKDV